MTDRGLEDQLEGLLSDAGSEAKTEQSTSPLEEAIVDLLAEGAKPRALQATPPVPIPTGSEAAREEHKVPAPDVGPPRSRKGDRRHTGITRILLHGTVLLGGVTLVALILIRFLWQPPITWTWFQALYFAACAVVLAITLIQWRLNASLSRALQEAEGNCAAAANARTLLHQRAEQLAAANARLQRRVLQLQTAVQISQAATTVLDPDALIEQIVEMIRERFDLHYAGLSMVDSSGRWAVLRAGTGEAGRQMLAQGHRVEVGDASTVGWCIAHAQARIAPDPDTRSRRDVSTLDALLPEIRSEIALPLRSHDRVIGALELHSTDREAFSQEDSAVLQVVADQIAVAIDNVQSFAQTRTRLEELEARQRRQVREQWTDSGQAPTALYYERVQPGAAPSGDTAEALSQIIEQALARRKVVVGSDTSDGSGKTAVVAPLSLRGEIIGTLGLCGTPDQRGWTDDEIALIEAVADQMALALENVRLLEETQKRAERERLIRDITAKVRASADMEAILRTAVRELGTALGTGRAFVRVGTSTHAPEE